MYEGLDTPLDATILDHFANKMSWVMTIHNGCSNHFQDRVLPMAYSHTGLMHGLLALSASHMYQAKKEYSVLERQHHHLSAALKMLQVDVGQGTVGDATMALIMVVCLIHVSDGATDGVYRWHLQKFRKFLWDGPRAGQWVQTDEEFAAFIYEFYRYHDIHAMLPKFDESVPEVEDSIAGPLPNCVSLADPKESATIGVLDGFDKFILRSKALRRIVRERIRSNVTPPVDYVVRQQGLELERELKEWDSGQEKETPRWYLAEIYRNCSWMVLYRTMQAGATTPKLAPLMDETFEYVRHLPPTDPCQAFLVAPVFRLGCSAFEVRHREKAKHFMGIIQAYSGMGNVGRAMEVLEKLWRYYDEGDPRCWDPEALMADMNYDFLIT